MTFEQFKTFNVTDNNIYAVIGHPINHTMSPAIHNKLFQKAGLNCQFIVIDIMPDDFDEAIPILAKRLKGFTVTIPYKIDIIKHLSSMDELVRKLNSCNVVECSNGNLIGYNTDIYGFLKSITYEKIDVNSKRAVILGSGGVARVIANVLTDLNAEVTLAVREVELGELFKVATKLDKAKVINIKELSGEYDILINCTPVGMSPNNDSPITKEQLQKIGFVFDTIYNPLETKLLSYCKKLKIPHTNGVRMLVQQAVKAQGYWLNAEYDDNSIEDVINEVSAILALKGRNLVLCGMMGSGKTTVGKKLAKYLYCDFIDVDEEIELKEDRTINEIFKTDGETGFRQIEKSMIATIFSDTLKQSVIALGGGAILINDNIANFKNNSVVVYLKIDTHNILERLNGNMERPLLITPNPRDTIYELLVRRTSIYESVADIIVDAAPSVDEVVSSILKECNSLV